MKTFKTFLAESYSSTVSLLDLYDEDELNDTSEALYDFVNPEDHDKEFTIKTMTYQEAMKLKTHHNDMTVLEAYNKFADKDQKKLVTYKMKHFEPNRIIVIANETVLDGNHQLIAAIKLKKPIKYIDVYEEG